MKRTYLCFGGVGLLFGIADWYFPLVLQRLSFPAWLFTISTFAIWLLPAGLVSIWSMGLHHTVRNAAGAVCTCWTCAIVAYYGYYAWLLAVPGLPQLADAHLVGLRSEQCWATWRMLLQATFLPQLTKWLPTAILGGYTVGYALGYTYCWVNTKGKANIQTLV